MPLIVIHNHIHVDVKAIEAKLDKILNKQTMAQETLDALIAKADAATTSLANIRQDIVTIKENLPASGGLTEAEVATLSAKLDSLAGEAAQLDSENA